MHCTFVAVAAGWYELTARSFELILSPVLVYAGSLIFFDFLLTPYWFTNVSCPYKNCITN